MGVSWVLLGLALGAAAIVLAMSIYILLYWSRPSEKWTEVPSRILVVFSFFFLFMLPVMIPLDRANRQTFIATPPVGVSSDTLEKVWVGLSLFAIFLAAFLLPLCNFYMYSRDGGETKMRSFFGGLWKAAVILSGTLGLSAIMWLVKGQTNLPATNAKVSLGGLPGDVASVSSQLYNISNNQSLTNTLTNIPIHEYFIVFATFLGSIIFTLFLSVGLFIYPTTYIIRFIKRPHAMNKDELLSFKKSYKQRSCDLLKEYDRIYGLCIKEYGQRRVDEMLKANERKALFNRTTLRKETRNFEKVERDLEEMEREYNDTLAMNIKETANPLKYYIGLGVGILFLVVSLLWYIQMIAAAGAKFYIIDKAFTAMDNSLGFPVLSILFYGGFTIYILFCFVNGITILGLKFVFFMKIYPMERNNTSLTGFVFNTMMMSVGALPSLLFFVSMLHDYSKDSGIYHLFYKIVTNALIFSWWFKNLYWFIIALAPVTVMLWIVHIFFQCKRCKIRKRSLGPDPEENERRKKKAKESEGLMGMFGAEKSVAPTKAGIMMSAAKNMIGLNS